MTDAVLDMLWHPEGANQVFDVYALLDGARDSRIVPMLDGSGLFHRCLYSGSLPETFRRASPHLVLLSPTAPFTRRLVEEGWGESWGIFLRSLAGLEALTSHFRKFLQVKDEAGKPFFFRFFDPRVLSAFLPSCTSDQLAEFFGPVGRFLVETAGGASVQDFYLILGELEHRRHPVLVRPRRAEPVAAPARS